MGVDRMLVLGMKENTNFWDGINKRWILVGDKYSFADKIYKVNKSGNTYHFLDKSGVADNFSSLTNIFDGIGVDVKYLGNE